MKKEEEVHKDWLMQLQRKQTLQLMEPGYVRKCCSQYLTHLPLGQQAYKHQGDRRSTPKRWMSTPWKVTKASSNGIANAVKLIFTLHSLFYAYISTCWSLSMLWRCLQVPYHGGAMQGWGMALEALGSTCVAVVALDAHHYQFLVPEPDDSRGSLSSSWAFYFGFDCSITLGGTLSWDL